MFITLETRFFKKPGSEFTVEIWEHYMQVLKYLSFILMLVALVGFYQSSLLHLNTLLYPNQAVSENWWISLGMFVVLSPAAFASHKLEENISKKDSGKIISGSRWIKYITLGLFAYGFIHYLFILLA